MAAPPTTTLPCVCPLRIEGFPGGSDGKESPCNVGDLGLIPGLGISPEVGLGNPLQCSCLENPHGQRNLVGYSPWGRKELDMTERLSTVQHKRTPRTEEPGGLQSTGPQRARHD